MATTYADSIYKEFKQLAHDKKENWTNDVIKNIGLLEERLIQLNMTKCGISDLCQQDENDFKRLVYLLQEEGIPLGMCDHYKIWRSNHGGWQYGCEFDKGKGSRIQVHCGGTQITCKRLDQLTAYLSQESNKQGDTNG